jgi:hypothetical protein
MRPTAMRLPGCIVDFFVVKGGKDARSERYWF